MCLYAFTRSDSTSAFKGKGKVMAIKLLQENPIYAAKLANLGSTWEVSEKLLDDLESFIHMRIVF